MSLSLLLLASVVSFILSYGWRSSFSKQVSRLWQEASNDHGIKCPKYILISFIGSIWCSYGMYLLIKNIKPESWIEALTIPVGVWLFILVASTAKHYTAANVSVKISLIHWIGDLISLVCITLILGY